MVRILDLADGFSSATAPDVAGVVEQIKLSISNNTTANVTGLALSSTEVVQALIVYHVKRESDLVTRKDQSGTYNAYYDGASWQISEVHIDGVDAGFQLGITAGGQVTYTTTNFAGTTHTNELNIRAELLEVI